MQDEQLPPHTYRAAELERLGISVPLNVVDTVCRRGLSHAFIGCLLLFLLLQVMPRDLLPGPQLTLAAEVLRWLLAAYLVCYGGRYVCYMGLRLSLRTGSVPLAVESHAVVVLGPRRPFRRLRSAVVYRECGAAQPRFFTGPVHAGMVEDFARGRMAVVFRHYRNDRLYTVDDENAYQTISGRGRVFGNLAFPDLPKGTTIEGQVVSERTNDEECGRKRRSAS